MKKIISIVLTAAIILSLAVPAFAAETCNCDTLPVVYVPGFGTTIYQNPGEENEISVFPPEQEAIDAALPDIIKAAVAGLIFGQYETFGTLAMSAAELLIGGMACNADGTSPENVGIDKDELPYWDTHKTTIYEFSTVDDVENPSEYYFNYDWRLDPIENAKELKVFIDRVKEITGHNEIVLSAHSQGNTIITSYLHLYGSNGIAKLVMLSPAYQGLSLVGSLLTRTATVKDKGDEIVEFIKSIMDYSNPTNQLIIALVSSLNKAGILNCLLNKVQKILDSQLDRVFDEFLIDVMGTMPGVWSFVPAHQFEEAKAKTFRNLEKYDELEEKVDYYHYNVKTKTTELIDAAKANGTSVVIIAGYNISNIPANPETAWHSDFLIDTKYMTLGATCCDFSSTLGENYKQAKTDCCHNHVSPDNKIDVSTATYPEYTWLVKGNPHNEFNAAYREFITWAILFDGQPTVHSNETYPQFISVRNNELKIVTSSDETETRSNARIIFDSLVYLIKDAIAE